jgi:glutathione S-transferase
VNLRNRKTATGEDFTSINPKGYVPALVTEPGVVLTEGTAVLQYLADLKPESGLAPAAGSLGRYRLAEWLGYINSEIHKNYSPLFNPAATDDMKSMAKAGLRKTLCIWGTLSRQPYLLHEHFFSGRRLLVYDPDMDGSSRRGYSDMPPLQDYQRHSSQRPSVDCCGGRRARRDRPNRAAVSVARFARQCVLYDTARQARAVIGRA